MRTETQEIIKALEFLHSCCDTVSEGGACGRCPIKGNCLELTSVSDATESITVGDWDRFIGYSDDVYRYLEDNVSNDDLRADYADMQRKEDRDERYFDELYGY